MVYNTNYVLSYCLYSVLVLIILTSYRLTYEYECILCMALHTHAQLEQCSNAVQ